MTAEIQMLAWVLAIYYLIGLAIFVYVVALECKTLKLRDFILCGFIAPGWIFLLIFFALQKLESVLTWKMLFGHKG